jgi:hypothetical protein
MQNLVNERRLLPIISVLCLLLPLGIYSFDKTFSTSNMQKYLISIVSSDTAQADQNESNKTADFASSTLSSTTQQQLPLSTQFNVKKLERHLQSVVHPEKLVISKRIPQHDFGYANRLYNIMNGFFISIVSNSTFQVDWPKMDRYVRIHLATAAINKLPSVYKETNSSTTRFDSDTANSWIAKKNLTNVLTEVPVHFETLAISNINAAFFEFACNPNYLATLEGMGLVRSETVARARRAHEKKLIDEDEKINSLYQTGFDFGHTVLSHVWRPSDNLQAVVDEFVETEHIESST